MMSTEARTAPSGGRESVESLSPQPCPPHFYPAANYQGPPQPPWFPAQMPPGSSGPWPGPWGYPGQAPAWAATPPTGKLSPKTNSAAMPSDEYTVDTMRRIYNDDDGRVEIQRVKVQRRQPETAPPGPYPVGPDAMSVVPVGTFPLNERRPPPRKNKLKRQMQLMQSLQGQQGPYPWYPYMPYMPYPYPYPYYYGGGCMMPPGMPPPPMTPWPGSDESERTTSRQESLPTTLDSQRLESRVSAPSRNSHSPVSQRSLSPAATTHSIAPSDSVSVCGYKNEESLRISLLGPTPPPRTKSRASRAIMAASDASSDIGDKSSYTTTSTDIIPYKKLPPKRKSRMSKTVSISDKDSIVDIKDNDSLCEENSVISDVTCGDSRLSSELDHAFRNLEQSVDVFSQIKVSDETTPVNTPRRSPSPKIVHSSDTITPTENGNSVLSSGNVSVENATDTYVSNSDKLEDNLPSTVSFCSLPQLETAPLESLASSATPNKLEEKPVSPDVPVISDSKHDENSSSVGVSVSVPQTAVPAVSTITETTTTTDATKTSDSPQTAAVQEINTSVTVTNTVISSTSDASAANVVSPSEHTSAQDSQSIPKEKHDLEPELKSEKEDEKRIEVEASSGRDSRASSSTFFSMLPSDDPLHFDTDSTDILLPTDATTADEGGEGTDWTASSPVVEDTESYQWVLQQPGEIPDLACSAADREDERRNAWRAEVSLWRARLVVSLCRGKGLDRQDWATFHLLVHHPLTLDLKLSMLHASRLCVANSTIGAALVRVALIHLAQHGETLLQPEASRQLGWRSIKVDPNQSWAPVKGSVEILKALGYREREDGGLRFPRRSCPEVSVLARLTLDMLVLAEELRLYLTGTHQYPTNISDLFFPTATPTPAPTDSSQLLQDLPRPPSSAGSYSYMSAQSDTSLNHRPGSRASSVTDEDTETLQASVRQSKSQSKKTKQTSSSEEEVTLKEELTNKSPTSCEVSKMTQEIKGNVEEKAHNANSDIPPVNKTAQHSGSMAPIPLPSLLDQSTMSLDMSSLPDLQSIKSSTVSLVSQKLKVSESNDSITPVATPTPDEGETKDNPEEHIYEEIDVIRQQVQALRASSVPVDIAPPPLPPKKKVSSGGEDDSGLSLTYPHMEWTSASMPGSLRGGSTGAKRKKRRAPMPPDFMPQDWKPYENRPQDETFGYSKKDYAASDKKAKSEYRRSLNPFYEDIDSVKAQVKELNKPYENRIKGKSAGTENGKNPFGQDEFVVSGYVGKNPFYEDIEEKEEPESHKCMSHSSAPSPKVGGSNVCAMGSLSELQDDSILIKAKRRAPKPPSTPNSRTATPQPPKSTSSPQPPKHPPNVPPPSPPTSQNPPKSPSSPQPPKSPSSPQPPKSPSSPQPPKSPSSSQPPKSSSSPQPPRSPSSPAPPKHPPTTPPPRPPGPQHKVLDLIKQKISGKESPNLADKNSAQNQNKLDSSEAIENTQQHTVDDVKDTGYHSTQSEKDGLSSNKKEEGEKTSSKTTKASLQRLSLQHPTIPPPPPPPKLDDDDEETLITPAEKNSSSGAASQNNPPTLFDDIPYMDANEVKLEKAKIPKPEPPQYEIPELPGKDGIPLAPPLSPTTMRQTVLLLSGHGTVINVPFIDESDLPPDCPPPPPPSSPPESPSETPKASPPDTPHVSPPDTPHVSPPETPHVSPPETPHTSPHATPRNSPSSSPITVTMPTAGSPSKDITNVHSATQELNPSQDRNMHPAEENKEVTTMVLTKDPLTEETSATSAKTTSAPDQEGSEMNDSKKVSASETQDIDQVPPLPPKTMQSPKTKPQLSSSSPPKEDAEQALQSSVSENRHDIPETSTQSPEATDKSDETAVKTDAADETTNDDKESTEPKVPPPETEERYEIPEVVRETALSIGPEGMPVRVGGPSHTHRLDMEAVFGPPKPPRRRRNNSLPPPRPPKSFLLDDAGVPKLPKKSYATAAGRPPSASTTVSSSSSYKTASAGGAGSLSVTPTSFRGTPKMNSKRRSKTRRSWPLLFCDCMYANCKNYDGVGSK